MRAHDLVSRYTHQVVFDPHDYRKYDDSRKYERALSDAGAEDYEKGEWLLEHKYFVSARWGRKFDGLFLDYGCGTGLVSRNLIAVGREVIATDISRNMCRIAKKIHMVPVVVADGLNLPFRDHAFSVICISGVLHHIPQQLEKAFTEIGRCSSNAICIIEPSTTSPHMLLRPILFLNKVFSWLLYQLVYKRKSGKYTFSIFEGPLRPEKLKTLCEKQGFKVSELRFFNHIPKLHIFLSERIRKYLTKKLISLSHGTDVEIIAKREM